MTTFENWDGLVFVNWEQVHRQDLMDHLLEASLRWKHSWWNTVLYLGLVDAAVETVSCVEGIRYRRL